MQQHLQQALLYNSIANRVTRCTLRIALRTENSCSPSRLMRDGKQAWKKMRSTNRPPQVSPRSCGDETLKSSFAHAELALPKSRRAISRSDLARRGGDPIYAVMSTILVSFDKATGLPFVEKRCENSLVEGNFLPHFQAAVELLQVSPAKSRFRAHGKGTGHREPVGHAARRNDGNICAGADQRQ